MAAPGLEAGFLNRNKLTLLLAAWSISVSQGLTWLDVAHGSDLSGIGFAAAASAILLLLRNRPFFGILQPFLLAWFGGAAFISWRLGMRPGAVFWQEFAPLALGLGLFSVLASLGGRTHRARVIFSCIFCTAALLAGTTFAWVGLDSDIPYLPQVCDPVLYRIDALLGFGSALPLARLIAAHGVLRFFVMQSYEYMFYIAVAAVFSEGLTTRKSAMTLPLQFIASALCVVPLYFSIPAIGPRFFFGVAAFPAHMPAMPPMAAHFVLAPAATVRNTMPSIHFSWALFIWYGLREAPWWQRVPAACVLGVTILATLGFGEHYLVDLVSAFPFVLLVRGLCCAGLPWRAPERWGGVLFGLSILLLWVLLVRAAPWSLAFPWGVRGLAVLSVAGAVALEARLARAELRRPGPARPLPQPAPVLPAAP